MKTAIPYSPEVLKGEEGQRIYRDQHLLQIAMPLGGIGAGCICMNGIGGLQDFTIRHTPHRSSMPDTNIRQDAAFGILRIIGSNITKLVEGPMPIEKIYGLGLKTQGYCGGGHEGLPRFRNCSFRGEYPFGFAYLTDPEIPIDVQITCFSPFIPLDVKNSAIPCAILEYTFENNSDERVEYEFSYHLSHLTPGSDLKEHRSSRNVVIPGRGVFFSNVEDERSSDFGSASLVVIGYEPSVKAMWYRGEWYDAVTVLWREVSMGTFQTNDGSHSADLKGRNGGSIQLSGTLEPGMKVTYPILISWYMPNIHFGVGGIPEGEDADDFEGYWKDYSSAYWRPYYVNHWEDAQEVAEYVVENYESLRTRTQSFHDALFGSTLPSYVLDAVSTNLAIIKSPTVLLQENGNIWGWEGCFCDKGCCFGSCTHVWNYAQAIPHLFPNLERTLREQELVRSMDEKGHVTFRSALPDGFAPHLFQAASDGQLGGIMKVYREWQISGDKDWLLKMYPFVKRSMDYCIQMWDPKHKGVLEEPHHNTYDIEFWGPDGMCTSFYLGALAAMARLAEDSDNPEDVANYRELAQKGSNYLDQHLFNGEYFEQKIAYKNLQDQSFKELIDDVTDDSPYELQLLKKEGPKYQYGSGCISNGVLGAWLAAACFVETPQNRENIRQNLQSIFQYNFKETLWGHANPQRSGFALGDEPGLLLCTWPRGDKPTFPFVYSDEVWTGIEYQVASHLISEGFVDEGLTIVKALRSRFNGHVRNPWDEYECGSYYARAMASYDLLRALSGLQYSAAKGLLKIGPKVDPHNFEIFFSTARGWGIIRLTKEELLVELIEGELALNVIQVCVDGETFTFEPNITAHEGQKISFVYS